MNASVQTDHSEQPSVVVKPPLRCLWLSRDIPFPLDAGDRIYSAYLAQALAEANVDVRYCGYGTAPTHAGGSWDVDWCSIPGAKHSIVRSLLSAQPRIAAMHATTAYRQVLQQQLQEHWDAIVLDGYASGWALKQCLEVQCLQARRTQAGPLLIYVSHNHETSLWRSMQQATSRWSLQRLVIWQNALKVRALERRLLAHTDLVTTITENDARTYTADAVPRMGPPRRVALSGLVLTPGYAGPMRAARRITHETPRHIVMLGSFRWVIKQENLRQLIAVADSACAAHDIVLDIIGDVPEELRKELQATTRATRFHGFVADPSEYLDQARIALVPEVVGGGFKLKFLDYVFARVPVFTITAALAGVPEALSQGMVCKPNLQELVDAVIENIDDVDALDALQARAFRSAATLFRWKDRGIALANRIHSLRKPS